MATKRRLEDKHNSSLTQGAVKKHGHWQGVGIAQIVVYLSIDRQTVDEEEVRKLLNIVENLHPDLLKKVDKGGEGHCN